MVELIVIESLSLEKVGENMRKTCLEEFDIVYPIGYFITDGVETWVLRLIDLFCYQI